MSATVFKSIVTTPDVEFCTPSSKNLAKLSAENCGSHIWVLNHWQKLRVHSITHFHSCTSTSVNHKILCGQLHFFNTINTSYLQMNKIFIDTHHQLVGYLGRCHAEADNVQYDVILEDISGGFHPNCDSKTNKKSNWTERWQNACTLATTLIIISRKHPVERIPRQAQQHAVTYFHGHSLLVDSIL